MQQHGTGGVPGGDTGGDTSDTVCGVCVWGGGGERLNRGLMGINVNDRERAPPPPSSPRVGQTVWVLTVYPPMITSLKSSHGSVPFKHSVVYANYSTGGVNMREWSSDTGLPSADTPARQTCLSQHVRQICLKSVKPV